MTIQIGLIGCGGIAEPHVKGYLKISEQARIVAVCDVVEANAQRRSAQVGGAQIFNDYHEMLANTTIDAVDICLPHHLHKDAIVAAANAGKHILCEKPLCLTVDEANEVEEAVQRNGVTLMCAHNQLYMPAVKHAKELIEEGLFGQVYEIRTTDSFFNNFDPANAGWRANRAFSGGGELIDTGYHPTYLLLYLAGSTPTEVTAMLSSHRLHFMDGEDSAQVLVRFANGAVGSLVTSWAYDPASVTEKFSVVAEKGALYSYGSDLFYKLRGQEQVKIELPEVDTFAAEIADFISCLQEKRRPINTEVEGIDVLKVILGAYQSVAEKRIVTL
ncbi:Gfo/Idh/MocA family protein [Tengunoibacter tsumagoiensis]|uniref:Dehydrogenase n=1 Tax=Tengunoibacter tsumagoiensis TaxID=2014871 RepID=A0A401ZU38_9CHLR|nr:Gfo/Idh/MocA family oxidoreductase [Tengunoibacter tsumagoiensis]GCE10438.1 dehydrogenase [Tengunoibacter tsumagoiensis]